MKVASLAVFFCVFAIGTASAAPKIKVGANLAEYKEPNKKQCDINVPKQYSTIQAAIDAAITGDTICIGRGTYIENVEIRKSIRLSGSGADSSIIQGQNTDAAVSTLYISGDGSADNVIVEGFQIRGVDSFNDNRNNVTTLNIGPYTSGTTLRHNWIVAGNAGLAVRADSGQNNELIYNNILEGNNSPGIFVVSGVQGRSGKVDFLNNTFTGTVSSTVPNFSGSGTVLSTSATDSSIQQNAFDTTGNISVLISSTYPSNMVNQNNLNSSTTVKVGTYSGGTLNAENNWWGDLDPSDNVQGLVDFTSFATKPFKQH